MIHQIEENKRQKEEEKLQINLDLLNDNEIENDEDDFIELETMRMKNQGFQEQVFILSQYNLETYFFIYHVIQLLQ